MEEDKEVGKSVSRGEGRLGWEEEEEGGEGNWKGGKKCVVGRGKRKKKEDDGNREKVGTLGKTTRNRA